MNKLSRACSRAFLNIRSPRMQTRFHPTNYRVMSSNQPVRLFSTNPETSSVHATDRENILNRIMSVIKSHEKSTHDKVLPTATFKECDLDSLDGIEIILAIEQEFRIEIPDADFEHIISVPLALNYVCKKLNIE